MGIHTEHFDSGPGEHGNLFTSAHFMLEFPAEREARAPIEKLDAPGISRVRQTRCAEARNLDSNVRLRDGAGTWQLPQLRRFRFFGRFFTVFSSIVIFLLTIPRLSSSIQQQK